MTLRLRLEPRHHALDQVRGAEAHAEFGEDLQPVQRQRFLQTFGQQTGQPIPMTSPITWGCTRDGRGAYGPIRRSASSWSAAAYQKGTDFLEDALSKIDLTDPAFHLHCNGIRHHIRSIPYIPPGRLKLGALVGRGSLRQHENDLDAIQSPPATVNRIYPDAVRHMSQCSLPYWIRLTLRRRVFRLDDYAQ